MVVVKFLDPLPPKGTIVKRPVKPKPEHVREAMLKRKPKIVMVSTNIKGGSLDDIAQQVAAFAIANHVSESEIVFAGTGFYSTPHIKVKRLETEEEFYARVKKDLDYAYNDKRWQYDNYIREEKRKKAEAARLAGRCVTCGK